MNQIDTPTLDKMLELQEKSQVCGEFLEFLQRKYAMFDKSLSRSEGFYHGVGDYINTEKLLAEFFGIDLEEAEKEKESIYNFEVNKAKTHHCKSCGAPVENGKVCEKCAAQFRF